MQVNDIPSVSYIRENYQYKGYQQFLNDHLMAIFSPYVTRFCIKHRIIPNYVTFAMIIMGIIGALLFAFPYLLPKIIGIMFIYLWYLMDLVDGEVARSTENFSKYGKEFDYTAHVIDHPLFTLSFAISAYQYSIWFSLLIITLGFVDTVFRSLQSFQIIRGLKDDNNSPSPAVVYPKGYIFKYIFLNLSTFPLFALLFPVLFLISWQVAFIYTSVVLFTSFVICLIGLIAWFKVLFNG